MLYYFLWGGRSLQQLEKSPEDNETTHRWWLGRQGRLRSASQPTAHRSLARSGLGIWQAPVMCPKSWYLNQDLVAGLSIYNMKSPQKAQKILRWTNQAITIWMLHHHKPPPGCCPRQPRVSGGNCPYCQRQRNVWRTLTRREPFRPSGRESHVLFGYQALTSPDLSCGAGAGGQDHGSVWSGDTLLVFDGSLFLIIFMYACIWIYIYLCYMVKQMIEICTDKLVYICTHLVTISRSSFHQTQIHLPKEMVSPKKNQIHFQRNGSSQKIYNSQPKMVHIESNICFFF